MMKEGQQLVRTPAPSGKASISVVAIC